MDTSDDLNERFLELYDAAGDVEGSWAQGDLAGAVRWLCAARAQVERMLPPQHPGRTDAPSERFKAALDIVHPGACNPAGIAHAIIRACRAARAEGVQPAQDPAVRLMVTQLAWLCQAASDAADYPALLAACRTSASEPVR